MEKKISNDLNSRKECIKRYLRRLGGGETLESVRADFVREFDGVEAAEIMRAEQELLQEGVPLAEVQRLCDVHSALFHGKTEEERAARTADYQDKNARANALAGIKGHPLQTLTRENRALTRLLDDMEQALQDEDPAEELLTKISGLSLHYALKGDLLYPHLKVKYGISGPSDVMWTTDDEIRDELAKLRKDGERGEARKTRLRQVLTRVREMIYKEQNILFPICAVNFTEEEWKSIYRDSLDYSVCFGVSREVWEEAEKSDLPVSSLPEDEIFMPGGHMSVTQLTAMLNTIPLEITFIDADNINRYFNEGPKVFKRPGMAIDRSVFSCHPPKVEPMVRAIIDSFRSGQRDTVPVWTEKNGRSMLVTYMAVRDRENRYVGTMEIVQDMEFAREHFSKS